MTFSIFLLLTMVAAIGVARLLRGLGLPGARIIGGLVVGIILGPVVSRLGAELKLTGRTAIFWGGGRP